MNCSWKPSADAGGNVTKNQTLRKRRWKTFCLPSQPLHFRHLHQRKKYYVFAWLGGNLKSSVFQNIFPLSDHLEWSKEEDCGSVTGTGDLPANVIISCLSTWENVFGSPRISCLALLFHRARRIAGILGRALEQLPCQRGSSAVRWSGTRQGLVPMCCYWNPTKMLPTLFFFLRVGHCCYFCFIPTAKWT